MYAVDFKGVCVIQRGFSLFVYFLLPVVACVWILQHVCRMEESSPAASSLDAASGREIKGFLYIHFSQADFFIFLHLYI